MSQKRQRSLQKLWWRRWQPVVLTLLLGLAAIVVTPHLLNHQTVQPTLAQDAEFEANRLSSLGLAYLAQKKYPKAIAVFRESVALAKSNPNPGGEGTKANVLNNLGAALYLNQQLPEAEQVFREAMAVMESLRDQQQGNELLTIQFFDNQQSFLYRTLQQVLVEQGKVAEALEIAERGRARILIEQLIRQRSRQLTAASSTSSASATPITVQQIQQVARTQNLTLVEYSLFPDTAEIFIPGRQQDELQNKPVKLYVWVVQPTGNIQFKSINLMEPQWRSRTIAQRVVATRKSMGVSGRSPSIELEPISPAESLNQLQELHKLLIEPIAQFLPPPNAHVAFIPQESLFLAPFAAINNSAASGRSMKQPLFSTSYAPRGGESTLDEIEFQPCFATSLARSFLLCIQRCGDVWEHPLLSKMLQAMPQLIQHLDVPPTSDFDDRVLGDYT